MGPWTLAERGKSTFGDCPSCFSFRYLFLSSVFLPCASVVAVTLRRRGRGQQRWNWILSKHWSGHRLMNATGVHEVANQNE